VTERPHRHIRSYVLRQGRITSAQREALDTRWHEYGVEFQRIPLQLDQVFGRHAPKVLDVGSGMGDATVGMAARHPENDYLAVEVHEPGAGSLILRAAARSLLNVRIIRHDVMDVLCHQLPDRSLDAICVFFPDPWPKKKHHKRRLINPEFVRTIVSKLKTHARLYLASDLEDMAQHMLTICDSEPGLINLSGPGGFAPRPRWRPVTKFERRGQRLGHEVSDTIYERREAKNQT